MLILSVYLFISYAHAKELSESDVMFHSATEAVKEKRYLEALNIFEDLGNNHEADAQYNLALLLKSGRGRPQNYESALKWGWLALLGNIEPAEALVDEIKEIMPDPALRLVRNEVEEFIRSRADKGNRVAISQMGDYFLKVPEKPEYKDAYLWFVISAAFQIEGSMQQRDNVEKEIEGKDILKIQSKALEVFDNIYQAME
jgi:TPR repeat protein